LLSLNDRFFSAIPCTHLTFTNHHLDLKPNHSNQYIFSTFRVKRFFHVFLREKLLSLNGRLNPTTT